MLTESYFTRTWSEDSSGFEDEDEWLLKTAFKQSSCQNRARMNLGLALDRASPNKENVTYLDADLFIGNAPPAAYNSPTKFTGSNHLASPHPRLPLDDQDPNSQDSGYCFSDDPKTGFRFVEPGSFASRRNSVGPSPRKEMTSPLTKSALMSPNMVFSRSMSSGAESTDDGFLDSIVNDKSDDETNFPSNMSSLLSGSIRRAVLPSSPDLSPNYSPMVFEVNKPRDEFVRPPLRRCQSSIENTTPSSRRVRTSLFRQQAVVSNLQTSVEVSPVTQLAKSAFTSLCLSSSSTTATSTANAFKRPEPPCKGSPILKKRRRSLLSINENEKSPPSPGGSLLQFGFEKQTVKLQRSMSASEATIMSALTRSYQDPELIGDFSKPFALPLTDGRVQDLKNISCDTLADLMKGEYEDQIANYTIVDCRYPYEYEGGHIIGAKNIYTKEQIHDIFVKSKSGFNTPDANGKRNILIFHCEFSSERGPNLSRFLRNLDRDENSGVYPALSYPEMYLLHGGYKVFYEKHKELCTPMEYRPMTHPDHENDLRKFRAKSKSWNGGDGKNRLAPRGSLKRLGL